MSDFYCSSQKLINHNSINDLFLKPMCLRNFNLVLYFLQTLLDLTTKKALDIFFSIIHQDFLILNAGMEGISMF
jgi:hypothetical protein